MRAAALLALLLAAASPARGEGLVLNFRDAEIGTIVETVARSTGQRFVYDSELRGRVTIILEDEISPEEALEVLNAALLTVGYATIPGPAGAWKILPIEAAKGTAPWLQREPSSESTRLVTTLVRLQAADPEELARILGQEARASIVLPYARTNGLIIAAPENVLAGMLEIVRALDRASTTVLEVVPLRYADAAAVANQLDLVFKPGTAPEVPWRIVVDERTNSLVVQAAPARVAEVRRFIETIDVPKRSDSGFHVVRVVNGDAETIAEQLSALQVGAPAAGASAGTSPKAGYDIVADAPTNSLVIRAAPAVFSELARVIGELDHIPPRVGIEAHVWDVQTSNALDLGFDALVPLVLPDDPNDTVAFATIGNVASLIGPDTPAPFLARFTRKPLVIPVIGPDGNATEVIVPEGAAQITASQGDVSIRVITSPYLLAASGEEQLIFAGDQVPIPVSSASAATPTTTAGGVAAEQDPFQTSLQIERQDVGVELRVKPIAVSDDVVTLELHIEISSVADTVVRLGQDVSVSNSLGPTLRKFNVDANVRLNSGAVVLIAAAPADASFANETGVPFLKDIPILGWFFRTTGEIKRRRRIVAAVQVNEIHSPEEQRAESIVRRLALERHGLRTDPLRGLTDAPYALHVATRASRVEAEQIAAELDPLAGTPAILPFDEDGATHYDVYLLGFDEISQLGALTVDLRRRGFFTRLEVVGAPRT